MSMTVDKIVEQANNAIHRAQYAVKQFTTPEMRKLMNEAEISFHHLKKAAQNRDWRAITLFSAKVVDLACRITAIAHVRHPWYTQALCWGTSAGLFVHKHMTHAQEEAHKAAMRDSVNRHRRHHQQSWIYAR